MGAAGPSCAAGGVLPSRRPPQFQADRTPHGRIAHPIQIDAEPRL